MEPFDWLTQARLPLALALAFAVAANDTVTGMASAVGGRLLPGRIAALLAAVAATVPALLLAGPAAADILARCLPDLHRLAIAPQEAGAAAAATALVALAATAFGWAVPSLLLLAAGIAACRLAAGGEAAGLATLVPVAVAAAVLPVGAALLALLAQRTAILPVLRHDRPRDRLRRVLPVLVGLSVGAGAWLVLEAVAAAYGGAALPIWLAPGLGLAVALAGFAVATAWLASRPFWVGNRREAVEAGHRRLALAGSLTLAFAAGGQQAVLAVAVLAVAMPDPAAAADPMGAWPVILIVAAIGIFLGPALLGHRPAARHGEAVAAGPASGCGANLAAGAALAAAGTASLPLMGAPAAAGALAGAALAGGGRARLPALLTVWGLAVLASAGLAVGLLQALEAA